MTQKQDNVELPQALGIVSTFKRKSSLNIFDDNSNVTPESAKTRCASPRKTTTALKLLVTTCTITRPVSSGQAMSAQSSLYQPNYMYLFMPYGYPQMYYYNLHYHNQYPQQPQQPQQPNVANSTTINQSTTTKRITTYVTFICFIKSLTFFNRSLMFKMLVIISKWR